MTQAKTTTIGVIGAGTMGSGIALTALRAGFKVTLHDIAPDALAQAEKYIRKHLTRKGHTAALEKLTLTAKLDDLAGANVVIEAALEELSLKQE
ncbi:MAG: 3-hydroxyacyl-CoA dehydrogenase NAD-binding domain-containing protein, partial [Anaerolineae bacterium]